MVGSEADDEDEATVVASDLSAQLAAAQAECDGLRGRAAGAEAELARVRGRGHVPVWLRGLQG